MTAVSPPTRIDRDRPLRVHIIGNSAAALVEPVHGPRDGGNYGEVLVSVLADAGVPTAVSHATQWYGRVTDFIGRYETDVRDRFPDVLVLNFGIIDCQSNALPTVVGRHLQTWHRTSRPGAVVYRRRVAARLWLALRRYQRWAGAHDRWTHRVPPARFTTDIRRLVDLARKDCGCLVLLIDIDPPGDRVEHWLPGTRERARRYNELLNEVTTGYDCGVRMVAASSTLTDPRADLPDGLHRSPRGHALTATAIADAILTWLGRRTG